MESKKTLWIIVLLITIVVAVIAVVVLKPKKEGSHEQDQNQNKDKQVKIERKEVEAAKIPEKIPTTVPFESGATIAQNYNASTSDGRSQSTRVFETKKSLAENFAFYQNFFKQNGWNIISTLDQTQLKAIAATKDGTQVQVTMSENQVTKVRTVDITATDVPK